MVTLKKAFGEDNEGIRPTLFPYRLFEIRKWTQTLVADMTNRWLW